MLNANNIVNKCLGKGMSMPRIGIKKDKNSKNKINYNWESFNNKTFEGHVIGWQKPLSANGFKNDNYKVINILKESNMYNVIYTNVATGEEENKLFLNLKDAKKYSQYLIKKYN